MSSLSASGRWRLAAVALLLLLIGGCAARPDSARSYPEGSGALVVEMTGFRSERGRAIVSLFTTAKGFPDAMGEGVRSLVAPIVGDRCRVVFTAVPWGEYALSALHDENGDGRMQSNWLGIPEEGHGVSNNPESRFGPPKFDEARFVFLAVERSVQIRIDYLDDRGPGSQRPQPRAE